MLNLIYDIDSKPEILVENVNNKKTYKIKGVFSTINEKNRNGRVYPYALWEKEVKNYQENFTKGSINLLMEYEHPPRSKVDPMQAVAKITKLDIEGNFVVGEAVLLDNEKASQLKSLIDNDIQISVSSRGLGTVKDGVVTDYKLITYDIVPEPSDFNATMNGIKENCILEEGILKNTVFRENGDPLEDLTDLKKDFTKLLETFCV